MNDQYVGDVGDFTKFALLRALSGAALEEGMEGRWAVLWWATRHAGGAHGDGRHLEYLNHADFVAADPEVVFTMRRLLNRGRALRLLEECGLLPAGTVFHRTAIDPPEPLAPRRRGEWRQQWLAEALATAAGAPLVFADPDNGLAGPKVRATDMKARKHVLMNELPLLAGPQQMLVLYHHATRQGTHAEQAERLRVALAAAFPSHGAPVVLRAPRYSARFYAVVPAASHEGVMVRLANKLRVGSWPRVLEFMGGRKPRRDGE